MTIEMRVLVLEKQIQELAMEVSKLKEGREDKPDTKEWKRNGVGDYMIKVLYPGILHKEHRQNPSAGFPTNRKSLSQQIQPGQIMLIYTTDPIKKIIGVGEVTSYMKVVDSKWKYSVDFKWVVPPKSGLTLEEAGLDIKVMVGDTIFSLTAEKANTIISRLKKQPDLEESTMDYIANEYEKRKKN